MCNSDFDIHKFTLLDHYSLGLPEVRARSLIKFRDTVVRPSLAAINRQLDELNGFSCPEEAFFRDDLASILQATVEGYLLTVQSMWERGLRQLLIKRSALCDSINVESLQKATWSTGAKSLQGYFKQLIGFPIEFLDAHGDINLLQNLGNAIRHGDGPSAQRVYQLAPTLWWGWMAPGESYNFGPFSFTVPESAPKHPSFEDVTLGEKVLEQMIQSVCDFWVDLDLLRCNSFENKSEAVVQLLEAWPEQRQRRQRDRVWDVNVSCVANS